MSAQFVASIATRIGQARDVADGVIPPVVTCTVCGSSDCQGCVMPVQTQGGLQTLSWEQSGRWGTRLWNTAAASGTAPSQFFGALPDGRCAPAFAFAIFAEIFAVGSLGVVAALIALLVSPSISYRIVVDSAGNGLIAGFAVGIVLMLVILHVIWGLCLEAGIAAAGGQACWRLGMRFGLYACGWDLLTSPAGALFALATLGPSAAWETVTAAIRVPNRAMTIYLVDRRKVGTRARQRAYLFSAVVLGTAMLVFAASLVWVAVHVITVLVNRTFPP